MAAVAIAINIGADRSNAVSAYFKKFAVLPPKNLRVDSTRIELGVATLENLMDVMLSLKDRKEFVIVTHGFSDGSGLTLNLVTRNGQAFGPQVKHNILTTLMTIAARDPAKVTPDDETALQIVGSEIKRLVDKMKKIKAMGITMIEFRGCNLGRNSNSVSEFRKFFGAAVFGAPKLHSFFGSGPARGGAQFVSSHVAAHEGTMITFPMTFSGKKALCCIGINTERKPEKMHIVADDGPTLDLWVQANFSSTATMGTDQTLAIHGLWEIPPIDPNDIFAKTPDPRPIFPLAKDSSGNNEYALNVVFSP